MNIFKSKLNYQNPIKYSNTVLKHITTITAMSALLAACGDHCVGGFKGYNHERCMQENEDETINTNTELEQTQSLEENTEEPELGVVQHVGHACSEPDDNAISTDFFNQEFKDNCETETRCESGRDTCDTFTCEVKENTFKICLSDQSEYQHISTNNGSYFNISCSKSSITQAPYCELRMGEDMQLVQEYSYQCEDGYQATLEAQHVRFFTKDIESNKTVCDDESGKCLTTTNYLRISSTLPDDLNDSCPTTNYGHCHAQDVTVTLEEKADGQKTYCLEATLNN